MIEPKTGREKNHTDTTKQRGEQNRESILGEESSSIDTGDIWLSHLQTSFITIHTACVCSAEFRIVYKQFPVSHADMLQGQNY